MKQDNIWAYWQNEGVSSFDGTLPRFRFLAKQVPSGSHVLNIGIGNANLERMLTKAGCVAYSLDPCEKSIADANRFLEDRAKVGRVESIPFADGTFDVVVMSEVLEHLDPETKAAGLAEVKRVLKPGGKFIGTVPDNERMEDNMVLCPCCETLFHRWGHVSSFTDESLARELRSVFPEATAKSHFFAESMEDGLHRWIGGRLNVLATIIKPAKYRGARNLFFTACK